MMLQAAYNATNDPKFLVLQRKAFDWFLGANDLRIPLYDFKTRGCGDGLMAGGVNGNQGAESTLSFMLSLLTVLENDAVIDKTKTQGGKSPSEPLISTFEAIPEPSRPTEDVPSEEDGAQEDAVTESS